VVGLVVAVSFITVCLWFSLRSFHWFTRARDLRLGLRGEQAVAEALNEAAQYGFRAFHDFPAERNVEH